jgi:hypothetical protein
MKIWGAIIAGVLLGAIALSLTRRGPAFETPTQCLDAYYAAVRAGDVNGYLTTLGKDFRDREQKAGRPPGRTSVRQAGEGLKNWVQVADPETIDDDKCWIDVDEQRVSGRQRLRYHFQKLNRSWYIDRIDPPKSLADPVKYGTHISDAP